MNIKLLAATTIISIAIASSLFFSGIIAMHLSSIILAIVTTCLASILVSYLISNILGLFLIHAVGHNNLKGIQQLIDYGANVNVTYLGTTFTNGAPHWR